MKELFNIADAYLRKFEFDEDIIQMTLIKLHANINNYRPERGSIQAYLNVIHNSVKVDMYRRRDKITTPLSKFDVQIEGCNENAITYLKPSDAPTPLEVLVASEKKESLLEAIKTLPQEQQEVIHLHYYEGLTYEQIVIETNYSLPKIKSLIFRAKGNLRKIIKKDL